MSKNKIINPRNIFAFLFKEERRSSVLLILAAVMALVIANSRYASQYFDLLEYQIALGQVTLDIQHWINEGLMAMFFLVVGIEIKRELVDGELKTWKRAAFPFFAAIGGMLVPALIFSLFNPYQPQSMGWGIPMATDIAIAIGVLALLGNRIPRSLRVFLLSLAIIDDIGSILIISIFYHHPTNIFALLLAVTFSIALSLLRKNRYWPIYFLILGFIVWYCLLLAGVSGTLAGLIIAFLMPLTTRTKRSKSNIQLSEKIEDVLIPITSFIVVPLFVFANAGISFSGIELTKENSFSVFVGVMLGLLIGKPVGIVISSWLASTLRLAKKPVNIKWGNILGVGFIAGIGLTISLLISSLAYPTNEILKNAAVLGIFIGSIIAGLIGFIILNISTKSINRNS